MIVECTRHLIDAGVIEVLSCSREVSQEGGFDHTPTEEKNAPLTKYVQRKVQKGNIGNWERKGLNINQ